MTPWKYSDDSYRDYTRTAWNESAQKYTKLLRNLEPYGFDLLARVDPKVRKRCQSSCPGDALASRCGARRKRPPRSMPSSARCSSSRSLTRRGTYRLRTSSADPERW